MSNDKICLLKAVADLPEQHAGFVLDIVNLLRLGDTASVRFEIGQAIASLRNAQNPAKALKARRSPIAKAVAVALLVMVGTVSVDTGTEKFVTREKFVVNTATDAKVKISGLNKNFQNWLLDKIDAPIASNGLRIQKLTKRSVDTLIIAEVGSEEKARAVLAEMFFLLEQQGHGQEGALLTNGGANIFYVYDINYVLRTVCARWSGYGWHVDAYSLGHKDIWVGGDQVFSRNPFST